MLSAAYSGCLGGSSTANGVRMAQPTDEPIEVPSFKNQTVANRTPDFTDAGYIMNATWHVGDEWHYLSNKTNVRFVKVLREEFVGNARKLVVEESGMPAGNENPVWRAIAYYDAKTLAQENLTYVRGYLSYQWGPGAPRGTYLHNGTFAYNETELHNGTVFERRAVRVNSFFANYQSVVLPWGRVEAGRVEHRILLTDTEGDSVRQLVIHFPYRDYGIDAQYVDEDDELWRLLYVRYGSLTLGNPNLY